MGALRPITSWERSKATRPPAASRSSHQSAEPSSAGRRATRSQSACLPAPSRSPSKRSNSQSMSLRTSDEGTAARDLNPESIADRTTVGVFFRQAQRYADRPLVHYPVGKQWKVATWADVRRDILAVASALVEAGGKPGELAHRNLVDATRAAIKVHPIGESDFTLSWLPFSHVFERINGMLSLLVFGGQTWLSGVDRLANDLVEVQPTILLSVPRVYE